MDPLTIGMLVILALLVFFMFRSSKKRQKQAHELQSKVVPGAEVMTNFGLYGTVVSIDAENNKVELDAGHGQVLTLHRQVVTRVIDPVEVAEVEEVTETPAAPAATTPTSEPEFGERIDPAHTESEHRKPGNAEA